MDKQLILETIEQYFHAEISNEVIYEKSSLVLIFDNNKRVKIWIK